MGITWELPRFIGVPTRENSRNVENFPNGGKTAASCSAGISANNR